MTRSREDILTYEKQALKTLPKDHPHYEEIRSLLIDQVNDELYDATYPLTNRRAS